MNDRSAFTLIELLIVIAIIAILASIAIPNILEAQVRAKVTRSLADMRSIATALEAYRVDNNDYPPSSCDGLGIVPSNITTPVAFITSKDLSDPFAKGLDEEGGLLTRYFTYDKIVTNLQRIDLANAGCPAPKEAIDHGMYNPGAFERYGHWRLVGKGPDQKYMDMTHFPPWVFGSDIPYDPTNGLRSFGNLFRLQNGRAFFGEE